MDKNLGEGFTPFWEGQLAPHLTHCGLGWGLPLYQVSSWSIQPFGHNTPTSQTGQKDRQTGQWSDSTGRTVLQTTAQTLKPGLVACYDIQPGNREGPFWFWSFIDLSLTYLLTWTLTHLLTAPGPTLGILHIRRLHYTTTENASYMYSFSYCNQHGYICTTKIHYCIMLT